MADEDPAIAAAHRRLVDAQEQVEHREFRRGARVEWMRVNELVESQMAVDDARDRRDAAVRDARRLGMTWRSIANALKMTEHEAEQQFAGADRLVDPRESQGPTDYDW